MSCRYRLRDVMIRTARARNSLLCQLSLLQNTSLVFNATIVHNIEPRLYSTIILRLPSFARSSSIAIMPYFVDTAFRS